MYVLNCYAKYVIKHVTFMPNYKYTYKEYNLKIAVLEHEFKKALSLKSKTEISICLHPTVLYSTVKCMHSK